MKILINFADENFRSKQKANSFTGKYIGGFDKIYEYSPSDIDDEFIKANKNIFDQKRGFGYWLWKPYIILKVLEQHNEGDYIFYCDSGAFFINSINHLIKAMDAQSMDVMLFETPLIECQWTNQYLFDALNLNEDKYRLSNQILATYMLVKKSESSISFIKEYLTLCSNEDYLTDKHKSENKIAIDHRHDQSILSLLAKSRNIIPFKDPSDYGKYPFKYFTNNRLFKIKTYAERYPVIILSSRKVHPLKYFTKYLFRNLIKSINK